MNLAQSALGTQLRHLEEELGVPLLLRHSRGVSATPAGHLFYRRVQSILAEVDRCLHEVAEFRSEPRESIRLGAPGSIVQLAASDLLARAQSLMPNVTITLVEDVGPVLFQALQRGELDIALAHDIPEAVGLSRSPWLKEELLFITSGTARPATSVQTPQDIGETIDLKSALERELTLPARVDGIRQVIEAAAGRLDLRYEVTYQVQSPLALKLLIADTNVASILPFGATLNELRAGTLRASRIVNPSIYRTLLFVRTGRRFSEPTEAALASLLKSIRLRLAEQLGPLATLL